MGIVDIDPSILGVFGSDLLTSAYFSNSPVDNGYIEQVHLDFTDSDNLNGVMYLDLNPNYDNVVLEGLPGDVNGDGSVGQIDLTTIINNWALSDATRQQGDLNGNGVVDGPDYTEVLSYWSPPPAPPEPAPEPATLLLLACGTVALAARRRRFS